MDHDEHWDDDYWYDKFNEALGLLRGLSENLEYVLMGDYSYEMHNRGDEAIDIREKAKTFLKDNIDDERI